MITDKSALLIFDDIDCIRGGRLLFRGVNFALHRGEALWLRGPNGCGKSSLIRVAAGLLHPARGKVTRSSFALLDERLALDSEQGLGRALEFWAKIDRAADQALEAAMAKMELTALADMPTAMLSAGQRKRAALARVIASSAALWLLDEPANELDSSARLRLKEAIVDHCKSGGAVLFASHQALHFPAMKLDLPTGEFADREI